jgi:hypothetical protein
VLSYFEAAVEAFNVIPTHIRTDHGGENILVWQSMLNAYPDVTSQNVVFVGSSVHNQRVERFNRDLNINIRQLFATIFYKLENNGILDVNNPLDVFSLHYVFLPRINNSLEVFKSCHNNHPIRTESNMTPCQLISTSRIPNNQQRSQPIPDANTATATALNDLLHRNHAPVPPTNRRADGALAKDCTAAYRGH